MRDFFKRTFALIYVAMIFVVLVMIFTWVIRFGFTAAAWLWSEALPEAYQAVRDDWLLIVAAILALLVVWSQPWTLFEPGASGPPKRGREVSSFSGAQRQARQSVQQRRPLSPRRRSFFQRLFQRFQR